MPSLRLPYLMPVLAVIVVAAVGGAAAVQRSTATTQADHLDDAHNLLTAMLDEETGLRGYLLNEREVFLAPFRKGTSDYDRYSTHIRSDLRDDERGLALVARGAALWSHWHELAEEQIAGQRRAGRRVTSVPAALERKR